MKPTLLKPGAPFTLELALRTHDDKPAPVKGWAVELRVWPATCPEADASITLAYGAGIRAASETTWQATIPVDRLAILPPGHYRYRATAGTAHQISLAKGTFTVPAVEASPTPAPAKPAPDPAPTK